MLIASSSMGKHIYVRSSARMEYIYIGVSYGFVCTFSLNGTDWYKASKVAESISRARTKGYIHQIQNTQIRITTALHPRLLLLQLGNP